MKAYKITYVHQGKDLEYSTWKIANSKASAIKFAFGKALKNKQKTMATKRGLIITITNIKEHEVSEAFPISELPKREPTRGVSDNGDWML